jgi:hypothetical protein
MVPSWRGCPGALEVVEDMIADPGEWALDHAVKLFQHSQEARMTGYPGLGSAGWDENANADAAFETKPGCHRSL